MNCFVEQVNETYRYEFWNAYEIPDTIKEIVLSLICGELGDLHLLLLALSNLSYPFTKQKACFS